MHYFRSMKNIYLDSAATTALRPEVIAKMTEVLSTNYGNPSSTHSFGRAAKSIMEQCRKNIASYFNVTAAEIIFTSGGTEADNIALQCAVRDLGVTEIITTKIEHHAVLHTVAELQNRFGIIVNYVNLNECGSIDYSHLETLLQSNSKKLVSLMHINNEVGNILDIKRVADMCKANNALFHSDTVQSVGHFNLDLQDVKLDFLAASAHKFHGPKGVGFCFVRKETGIKGLLFGGEQERGFRAGTESLHNIVGMDEALRLSYLNLEDDHNYIKDLKAYFISELNNKLPGCHFNGQCSEFENSTYTLVNVCLPLPPEKSVMLQFQLDLKGICCSKGSACQSGSGTASHVLKEMLCEEKIKQPSVRFSFSKFNTKEELDYVVTTLCEFANS